MYEVVQIDSMEDAEKLYEILKEKERRGEIILNGFEVVDHEEMMKLKEKEKKKLR